ncbi:hypothetical protein IWQ61_008668 [Dispira simplex]|nr:hypothetical protein IWQ61_008668 [Dispira simplex]
MRCTLTRISAWQGFGKRPKRYCFSTWWDPSASNAHVGQVYEHAVVHALKAIGLDTYRTGRAGDRGIDFRATWHWPPPTTGLPVVGQCKFSRKSQGQETNPSMRVPMGTVLPTTVRDLEGTLTHEDRSTLGMLVSNQRFGLGAIRQAMGSQLPLLLLTLSPVTFSTQNDGNNPPVESSLPTSGSELRCYGCQWNHAADRLLPSGLVAVPHYTTAHRFSPNPRIDSAPATESVVTPEVILLLNGRRLSAVGLSSSGSLS